MPLLRAIRAEPSGSIQSHLHHLPSRLRSPSLPRVRFISQSQSLSHRCVQRPSATLQSSRLLSSPRSLFRTSPPSLLSTPAVASWRTQAPTCKAMQVRHATHGTAGRANGPGDSAGRRLGAKKGAGEYVVPGNIIFRQRGTKWHPGHNVHMGRDHTIHAAEPGYVVYYADPSLNPRKKYIGVTLRRDLPLPRPQNAARVRRLGYIAKPRRTEGSGEEYGAVEGEELRREIRLRAVGVRGLRAPADAAMAAAAFTAASSSSSSSSPWQSSPDPNPSSITGSDKDATADAEAGGFKRMLAAAQEGKRARARESRSMMNWEVGRLMDGREIKRSVSGRKAQTERRYEVKKEVLEDRRARGLKIKGKKGKRSRR